MRRSGLPGPVERSGVEWGWILDPGSWSADRSIVVCCLSCHCDEAVDPSVAGDPCALVAPFARANYYRRAMRLLRAFAELAEASHGIPRRSIRLFSNSRIPEKPLLAASGLGTYGRNGCCIVPGLGSLFVIAGAVVPAAAAGGMDGGAPAAGGMAAAAAPDPCGSCDLCIRACPTGAIVEPGIVDPDRCLQAWAADPRPLPEPLRAAWGARLYGCQACQSVCPHNRALTEPAPAGTEGEIGPGVPLRLLLARDPSGLKEMFRGTALGLSWITGEALLRNSLLAAGNRGDASVRDAVRLHAETGSAMIRETALWALERLS
jgi:epoxyqueuosine reductase